MFVSIMLIFYCIIKKYIFAGSTCTSSSIECLTYCSVPSVCTSDHKPVWGLYKCSIRPGIDT